MGGLEAHVLGEAARGGAGREDALDGAVLESAKRAGVGEGPVEIGGGVALAQEQDAPPVVAGVAALRRGEPGEEAGAVVAEVGEGLLDDAQVGAAAVPGRVDVLRIDVDAAAAGRELVARDQAQIGGVDEELVLGDSDREDLGNVVVGDRIAIAVDGDEAVDGADPVMDARGVIWMERQRPQERLLLGKHLQLGPAGLPVGAGVAGVGLPDRQLAPQVLEVAEAAGIEEAALEFPEAALDAGLVVGVVAPAGQRRKLVVRGVGEEARVVDRLIALPSQDYGLLAVVLASMGGAIEAGKGGVMAVHQRVVVAAKEGAATLARRVGEHVREDLDHRPAGEREVDGVR